VTSPSVRLAVFALVLALAGTGAAAVGSMVGDDVDGVPTRSEGHAEVAGGHEDAGMAADGGAHGAAEVATPAALPGLAVAEAGTRLDLRTTRVPRPGTTTIALRILGDDGRAIRRFDLAHDRRMHLVIVRRDLAGFQHLHPRMATDGTWRVTARLAQAGTYRVFADFTRDGTQRTLGADLQVGGDFAARDLGAVASTARSDRGADVHLRRDGDRFAFDVKRDGRDVSAELKPYLGAKGHLVTLRVGDLAYLHTHPDGDALAFESALPTPGRYRLWVQFRLDGVVHTAAFTQEQIS